MVPILDFKQFFKFFIHKNNDWTEGHAHKVVDEEASVKGNESFVFVHGLDELSGRYPLIFSPVNLQSLFNDFSGCHNWIMEQGRKDSHQSEPVTVFIFFAVEYLLGLFVDGEVNGMGGYATQS